MHRLSALIAVSIIMGMPAGAQTLGDGSPGGAFLPSQADTGAQTLGDGSPGGAFLPSQADTGAQTLGDGSPGGAFLPSQANKSDTIAASVAQNAHYIFLADQGGFLIDRINAGPNDRLDSVTIVYNYHWVDIPGKTITAGSDPGSLKTSLTSEDLKKP
jgi:hypothetical protein